MEQSNKMKRFSFVCPQTMIENLKREWALYSQNRIAQLAVWWMHNDWLVSQTRSPPPPLGPGRLQGLLRLLPNVRFSAHTQLLPKLERRGVYSHTSTSRSGTAFRHVSNNERWRESMKQLRDVFKLKQPLNVIRVIMPMKWGGSEKIITDYFTMQPEMLTAS